MKEDYKKSEKNKIRVEIKYPTPFVLFVFLCNLFHALWLCLSIYTNAKLRNG